jgi:hypothetical protein
MLQHMILLGKLIKMLCPIKNPKNLTSLLIKLMLLNGLPRTPNSTNGSNGVVIDLLTPTNPIKSLGWQTKSQE